MMKKLILLFLAITCISISAYSTPPCTVSFTTDIEANGDTVCMGVPVTFTNTSDVGGETLNFKQWDFGDGTGTFSQLIISHTFIQAGTYIVTFQRASNSCPLLSVQRTITVIDPPNGLAFGSNVDCFGDCDGTATLDIQIAPHNNYNIVWSDPTSQTTTIATELCAGTYWVDVSDVYGCAVVFNEIIVFEPNEIVVEAGSDIQICDGDQWSIWDAAVVSGGQAPFTYLWTPGDSLNFDTLLNPIITAGPAAYGVYTLTVTDADGCSGSNDLEVTQSPGAIHGTVFESSTGGVMNGALVSLIKVGDTNTQWETYDTFTTLADGMFHFINIPIVDYLVMAEVPGSPDYMPIYYHVTDTVFDWEDAQVTSVGCGEMIFNTDINMVHSLDMPGTCTFEGYVYLVGCDNPPCKTQTEDPIPLIDVIVKKTPPGNAIAWTQTGDSSQIPILNYGQFKFTGMPSSLDSTYSFVVNIPGLGMQGNYSIEVAVDDSLYQNLNFYVDTTPNTGGIYTYNPLGVEALKYKPHEMMAYPNPFADNCELRFTNIENTGFSFTLFDVTGKQILRDEKQQGNTYTIKTQNLDQGIYIAEVKTGDEVFRTRVMKK